MNLRFSLGLVAPMVVVLAAGCGTDTPGSPKASAVKAASSATVVASKPSIEQPAPSPSSTGKPGGQPATATGSEAPKGKEIASAAPSAAAPVAAAEGGWGTIKGQIVFAGEPPARGKIDVTKDQDHCLAKGPLLDEKWVVDKDSKGVRWIVVFLKPDADKPLPVHDTLKSIKTPEVVLDQPMCQFEPHVLAIREGQKLVAKNPSAIAHNVVIQGFKNDYNIQIPPGRTHTFELVPERNAVALSCGAHPWMKGYGWIFDHPYFAVTDEKGNFEIKNVPSGMRNLVVWHETGYLGGAAGRNGKPIAVEPDKTTDLGKIEIKAP